VTPHCCRTYRLQHSRAQFPCPNERAFPPILQSEKGRMSSFHSHTSAGSTSTDDDIVKARLKALTDPACADCSATRPNWASLIRTPHTSIPVPNNVSSVVAFVCNHCVGHHRSLGTQVCRVKSCTLDKCKLKSVWICGFV
jgi:hypothetical protein